MRVPEAQLGHCVTELRGLLYLYTHSADKLWGPGSESALRLLFSLLFVQLAMVAERRSPKKKRH